MVEKYNGTVWKAITLALKSQPLPTSHWETVLPDALHIIRSLLCTANNCTPHERLFNFTRNSSSGYSVPSWLNTPGKVLLKRQVRNSKHAPMVDEVELIEANPHYAFIRTEDGKETTVSTKHLAPYGERDIPDETSIAEVPGNSNASVDILAKSIDNNNVSIELQEDQNSDVSVPHEITDSITPNNVPPLRRSSRVSKPTDRYVP